MDYKIQNGLSATCIVDMTKMASAQMMVDVILYLVPYSGLLFVMLLYVGGVTCRRRRIAEAVGIAVVDEEHQHKRAVSDYRQRWRRWRRSDGWGIERFSLR